jgi:hypothetical protein
VSFGEPPRLFGVEPPRPQIESVRIVDMGASNSWAEFATLFLSTRSAFLDLLSPPGPGDGDTIAEGTKASAATGPVASDGGLPPVAIPAQRSGCGKRRRRHPGSAAAAAGDEVRSRESGHPFALPPQALHSVTHVRPLLTILPTVKGAVPVAIPIPITRRIGAITMMIATESTS